MSGERAARAVGLACPRCGGALTADAADPAQLLCRYCQYTSLRTGVVAVAGCVPAGRIGRRRAAAAAAAHLRAAGVRAFAVEGLRLYYVPFWELKAKLVGWQRYRLRRAAARAAQTSDAALVLPEPVAEERVEEVVARDVTASSPACEAREFGLLGIADRMGNVRLRPLDLDRLKLDEIACAVVRPLSAAKRALRQAQSARVLPAGAVDVRQRLDLLRPHATLIYYPVYRVAYRSAGVLHVVFVDALRGRPLAGSRPLPALDRTLAWLAAAALAGFLVGVHPVLAGVAIAGWALARLRDGAGTRGQVGLGGWLSEELGGGRGRAGPLSPWDGSAMALAGGHDATQEGHGHAPHIR